MKYCKDCLGYDECKATGRTVEYAVDDGVCIDFDERKPKTNADRIRAMTDEELAKWMSGGATMSDSSCYYCKNNKLPYCDGTDCTDKSDADIILEWLQQPAEGE